MLKVGCAGFPVARSRYFQTLKTVEIASSFLQPPRPGTARAWREEAPEGFDFSIRAWKLITHPATHISFGKLSEKIPEKRRPFCGHFKPTAEVARSWEATRALAAELGAKFIVFETPASFYPDANHLRDMYRFFKENSMEGALAVWEPRGSWEPRLIAKVCADLGLIRAVDPSCQDPVGGRVNYFRVGRETGPLSLGRLGGGRPSYLYFTSRDSWRQARGLLAEH